MYALQFYLYLDRLTSGVLNGRVLAISSVLLIERSCFCPGCPSLSRVWSSLARSWHVVLLASLSWFWFCLPGAGLCPKRRRTDFDRSVPYGRGACSSLPLYLNGAGASSILPAKLTNRLCSIPGIADRCRIRVCHKPAFSSGLLRFDDSLNIVPDIASGYAAQVSPDGRLILLH